MTAIKAASVAPIERKADSALDTDAAWSDAWRYYVDSVQRSVLFLDVLREAAANIVYVSPHFYKVPVMLLYLAATCIGCFFSSVVTIRLFGVLALFLFGIAYVFFAVALFSV